MWNDVDVNEMLDNDFYGNKCKCGKELIHRKPAVGQ